MVKNTDTFWLSKITKFKAQQNRNSSENSSFLLDILQGLYEDISESTKVELLLILQEHGDSLIQGQELAEQAVGSVKSILEDLLDTSHDKYYATHCLVTTITLIIEFELEKFNPQLVNEIIKILMRICMRTNVPGEILIRKVACECLLELENAIPSILEKYVYQFYEITKQEKSYAAQSYMQLLSTVLFNALQNEDEVVVHASDDGSEMSAKIMKRDAQQMASFISGELNYVSSAAQWHIGLRLSYLFEELQIPKVVLHNKMMKCCHSSDLQIVHLGLFLAFGTLQSTITGADLEVVASCLLRVIGMPQFPNGMRAMCLQWLLETIQQLDFMDDMQYFAKDASSQLMQPLIFDGPNMKRGKIELLSELSTVYPTANIDFLASQAIILKLASYGISGRELPILYRASYLRFTSAADSGIERKQIIETISKVTLNNPSFMAYTVDFISAINDDSLTSMCKNLIHDIAKYVLKLKIDDFICNSENFFPLIELACSEKGLWPMGVVKWLRSLCVQSGLCQFGDWQLGSSILSICRGILGTHDSIPLLQELADFLWYLHKSYNDQDIKDRALFYYLVIGHASPKYFKKMFADLDGENRMQSINKRGEIEIPSDLVQGVLPTVRLDKEFLSLKKRVKHGADRSETCQNGIFEDVAQYYSMVNEKEFDKAIHLDLSISYNEGMNEVPPAVYAMTLRLDSNGSCDNINEVHIPYLSKVPQSKFPCNKQIFAIDIKPKQPFPCCIQVCCLFTDGDSRTCVAPIEPLKLNFADMFNPLISIGENSEVESKKKLFDMLWEHFGRNQTTTPSTERSCAVAVKRLIIAEGRIRSVLERALQPCFVCEDGNKMIFGIFLPPRYHLLLVFEISNEETLVRFRVDDWQLLDIVEEFLEELANSQINSQSDSQ